MHKISSRLCKIYDFVAARKTPFPDNFTKQQCPGICLWLVEWCVKVKKRLASGKDCSEMD